VVDLPAERISGTIDWALNAPTKARVVEAPAPTEIPTEAPAPAEIPAESPNTKPDPQTVLDRLSGSAQRMVFDASRATVHTNSDTKTKFARYASANACAFCQVMATRGPVYNSDRSATRVVGRYGHARGTQPLGGRYHDHCRCIAVPVPGGETYTPPDYVGDWETAYLAARDDGHTSLKAILSHMRAHTDAR
jgi:hypothetical protein